MPPEGFEPTIPASELQQRRALSSAASWGLLLQLVTPNDTHAHNSIGLLWTRHRLVAETSTWQHATFTRQRLPCPRRDSNPQTLQKIGCRPTPYATTLNGLFRCHRSTNIHYTLFFHREQGWWMMSLKGLRPKWPWSNGYSSNSCVEASFLAEMWTIQYRIQVWSITTILTC
jgi:hypothetical protein